MREEEKRVSITYSDQLTILEVLNSRDLPCRFVNFSVAHVYLLGLDPWQRANMEAHPNFFESLRAYSAKGISLTALSDGKPVLSFGVMPFWPGVAEVWMLRGATVSDHGLAVAYGARLFFNQIGPICGLWRAQISVQSDNKRATKFAQFCKFEVEGLMRDFGPEKSDYFLMSRLYQCQQAPPSKSRILRSPPPKKESNSDSPSRMPALRQRRELRSEGYRPLKT